MYPRAITYLSNPQAFSLDNSKTALDSKLKNFLIFSGRVQNPMLIFIKMYCSIYLKVGKHLSNNYVIFLQKNISNLL